MAKLTASILSSDFSKLGEEVKAVEKGGASYIHIDVMDGHFVPNISFGEAVMKSIKEETSLPYDVHLMIERPDEYLEDFITEKTEFVSVHSEATRHMDRTLRHIKDAGAKAGIAINPATPISTIKDVLPIADLVLVMSVNPGFGGQKFIDYTLEKVRKLDEIRKKEKFEYQIEVDGGVDLTNVKKVVAAGTDLVVVGSAIFSTGDAIKTTKEFCDRM